DMRTTPESIQQILEPLRAAPVVSWQILRKGHVRDSLDGAPQMVENQQGVNHQQVCQGQLERIVSGQWNSRLELARQFVGEIPDRAAAEAWQARQPRNTLARHHAIDQIERVVITKVRRSFGTRIGGVVLENGQRTLEARRHK